MQTSDLNVNNTESDHANAIFLQFQDAVFSREHFYVKTLTKIIFDLLQWQEIAKLSLPKKAAIASFIWTTFPGHFRLGANDITRNRPRVIFSRACVDIFRQRNVWLQIIFCSCVNETTLSYILRSFLSEKRQIASLPEDVHEKNKLGDRMIKQLLNSVIAKYRDLSVSRRSVICQSRRLRQIINNNNNNI